MGISDKLKSMIHSGLNVWNGDSGEAAELKAEVLKQEVQAANIIDNMHTQEQVDALVEEDLQAAIAFQQEAEANHRKNLEFIHNTSRVIHSTQVEANAEEERARRNKEIEISLRNAQLKRERELNRVKVAEGFNFYKVKDNLESGLNLKDSFMAAGCVVNNIYKLDYSGRGFLRLRDEEVDNVCLNARQNITMNEYLKSGNATVVLVGVPNTKIYSIGLLIYNREFGFILIKTDRDYDSYVTELVYKMEENGMFNGDGFDIGLPLSKTFVKIAGSGAFCYNTQRGLESEEDYGMFKEMQDMNRNAAVELNNVLKSLGLGGLR